MDFRTPVNTIIRIPCRVVRTGRRIDFRLMAWNDSQPTFGNPAEALRLKIANLMARVRPQSHQNFMTHSVSLCNRLGLQT